VVLFVVDPDSARAALRVRMIKCPERACTGRLGPWSAARARTVTVAVGQRVRLVPDRGRCTTCGVTHTLLPTWYVPRRSCGIELFGTVITSVVNYGHRPNRIAEVLRLARTTVRRWTRGLATADTVFARLAAHIDVDLNLGVPPRYRPANPPSTPARRGVALALDQLAYAATAIIRFLDRTGARLSPWAAINLASAGRLPNMINSGVP
jgi:hypothetical protein